MSQLNPTKSEPLEALGQSESFLAFQERLSQVAKVNRPVLIIGERGTGKELAINRLHYLSERWQEPLVTLDCAALAPNLIESELFGHSAGAFTGATAQKVGRFEAANKGTLFLDELGNIPLQAQEKILRVVEYGTFESVGSSQSIEVDVRLIGATNADLKAMAKEGSFKADLLDRLSFEVLYLPPLRERRDDIILLAHHFAQAMAKEIGKEDSLEFSEEALQKLVAYPWPGNIRQLKNVIERAVYWSETQVIHQIVFDPFQSPYAPIAQDSKPTQQQLPTEGFVKAIDAYKIELFKMALEKTKYNQSEAAKLLKMTYHQFRGFYRKYQKEFNLK